MTEEDLVKITLCVPNEEALKAILSRADVHLDCGIPRRDESGNFRITLYATVEEARKITSLPLRKEAEGAFTEHHP